MARKKPVQVNVVGIRVLVSFNGMYAGDTAVVPVSQRVQGWINAGLVVSDGESQAGPGAADPNDSGSVALGAGDDSPAGDEQSQGFGSGDYGASEGQHPH